jgi:hypothetical protein
MSATFRLTEHHLSKLGKPLRTWMDPGTPHCTAALQNEAGGTGGILRDGRV